MSLASPLRALGSALLMASVMGCSAKLSEADVEQALAQIDQAIQQQDLDALDKLLAPQVKITIDMSAAANVPPQTLGKEEYLTALRVSWAATGTSYRHERSNTRISLTPNGKGATASATIHESMELQGVSMTSVSEQISTFALTDGKLKLTQVNGRLLSIE